MNAFSDWLSSTPVLFIAAILLAAFAAALSAGWFFGAKLRREHKESDPLLTSAVLGLLALLLGFTYSLAVDRYEARRLLVQDEANAISTMYLRAQLLEEPHRTQISRILIDYADNRIAPAKAQPGEAQGLLERNDGLLRDFWTASAAAFPSIKELDFSSTFYDSVNLLIDLDASRKSARLARVPPVIFILLFAYIAVVAALLGFFRFDKTLARRGLRLPGASTVVPAGDHRCRPALSRGDRRVSSAYGKNARHAAAVAGAHSGLKAQSRSSIALEHSRRLALRPPRR